MATSVSRSGKWVCTLLSAMLKSKLPAKIVEANTAFGDNISIPEPHTDSYIIGERQKFPEQFPILFFLKQRSIISDDESRYEIERWETMIDIMHVGETEDNLETELDRLVVAIQECVLENNTLLDTTGKVFDAWPNSKAFGNLLTDGNALLQEAQLGVMVGVSNTSS